MDSTAGRRLVGDASRPFQIAQGDYGQSEWHSLCAICETIDFHRLLSAVPPVDETHDWHTGYSQSYRATVSYPSGHVRSSSCPLCTLIAGAISPESPDGPMLSHFTTSESSHPPLPWEKVPTMPYLRLSIRSKGSSLQRVRDLESHFILDDHTQETLGFTSSSFEARDSVRSMFDREHFRCAHCRPQTISLPRTKLSAMKQTISRQIRAASKRLKAVQGESAKFSTPLSKRHTEVHHVARRLVDSSMNFPLIKRWIHICDSEHINTCRDESDGISAPLLNLIAQGRLRFLDVTLGAIVAVDNMQRYLALSYVWVDAMKGFMARMPATVLPTTLGRESVRPIERHSLPKTLREVWSFMEMIGERYVWVDALCVNQSDAEETAALIPEMGSIYGNAYFTIIAATGHDADAGLYPSKKGREDPTMFNWHGKRCALLPSVEDPESVVGRSKWASRAWTYQERLLSRRSLVFTDSELFFTCGQTTYREAYVLESHQVPLEIATLLPSRFSGPTFDGPHPRAGDWHTFQPYRESVPGYTRRQLTQQGDRLDAFSGVLNKLYYPLDLDEQRKVALSGFPLTCFVYALFWTHLDPNGRADHMYERIQYDARRSRKLPSWSWVGWSVSGWVAMDEVPFGHDGPATPTFLDDRNIVMPSMVARHWYNSWEGDQWPVEPQSCYRDSITLHLYVKCVECRLQPVGSHSVSANEGSLTGPCCVLPIRTSPSYEENWGQGVEAQSLGTITISTRDPVCRQDVHEILLLHTPSESHLMLIRRAEDGSAERVAMGRGIPDHMERYDRDPTCDAYIQLQ